MGFCPMKRQCPDDKGMDCSGKRSATPLSQAAAIPSCTACSTLSQSGIALRLPPQSILVLSVAGGAALRSNGFSLTSRADGESNPRPVYL